MNIHHRARGTSKRDRTPRFGLMLGLCGLILSATQPSSASAQDPAPRVTLVEAARATLEVHGPKDNVRFRNSINSMAYAPDGLTIAVGMRDPNLIVLLDPATLAVRARLEGHKVLVMRLVFSPDGKTLVSSAADGTVRIWDVAARQETLRLDLFKANPILGSKTIQGLAISPDGQRLYTGQRTLDFQSTLAWDLKAGQLLDEQIRYQSPIQCLQVSPDGLTLATAARIQSDTSTDQSIRLWDLATSTEKAIFDAKDTFSNHVEFTPDGKSLAAVFYDRTIRLFDTAKLTEKYRVQTDAKDKMFLSLTMSPDGATLATSDENRLQLWRTVDGAPIATIPDTGGRIIPIQFAPDGRSIAVAGPAGFVRVFKLERDAR